MKTLLERASQAVGRYLKINRLINDQTGIAIVLKTVLWALLTSALMVLIPVLFLINMFIYTKLTLMIAIGLLIMVLIWVFLYFLIYYKLLHIYVPGLEDVNTRLARLVETAVSGLLFLAVGIAILFALF